MKRSFAEASTCAKLAPPLSFWRTRSADAIRSQSQPSPILLMKRSFAEASTCAALAPPLKLLAHAVGGRNQVTKSSFAEASAHEIHIDLSFILRFYFSPVRAIEIIFHKLVATSADIDLS
jgi:hypothetical protein